MAIKKYLITEDKLSNTPVSTEQTEGNKQAFSAYGASIELAKKLDVAATSSQVGYAPIVKQVGSTTEYKLQLAELPSGNVRSNWDTTDTTAESYLLNKPFQKVGTGLTVKDIEESGVTVKYLTADTQLHFQIFESLPTASETYTTTIALVKKSATATTYYEYACVNTGTTESPAWKWEQIGAVDLQIEQTETDITINGTALNKATSAQCGIISKEDWTTFNSKQAQIGAGTSGKVEVVKYTETAGTVDKLEVESTIATETTNTNLVTNGAVYGAIKGKVGYAPSTVSTASISFMVGKDTSGYFMYEE